MRRPLTAFLALGLVGACGPRHSESPAPLGREVVNTGVDPALPAPDTTHDVRRFSVVRPWPSGRTPVAPPGFTVSLYADGFQRPRWLYVLPNGDVLVAESANPGPGDTLLPPDQVAARWASGNRGHSANRVTLLRDTDGDGRAERRVPLLWGLNRPVGMLYLDGWLYVANTDELVRYPFQPGDTAIMTPARRVLELPAGGYNNHWTRNVVANADGTKLYVTVGSATNVDTEGIDARDPRRAAILEVNPDGSGMRIFASGLRNPVGMDWAPGAGTLWTVVNERDGLGDDLVPDYLTSVRDGGFYGWPYAYWGRHEDPRQRGRRPDLVERSLTPDFALGAHTASLGLRFYRGNAFPERYRGGAFVGQRGSWNRSELAGYRVLFVPFSGGRPAGPAEEFLGGFLADRTTGEVYGRPLAVAELPDGSLLVADDPANRIWRVAYGGGGAGRRTAEPTATRVAEIREGLARPEAARWDPGQRVWFVSNINGRQEKDNNGYISRLTAEGRMETARFVEGGRSGVTLHAPKGLALVGDTLWVTDLDAVRGFHRRTGAPLASIDLAPSGALFLNDITSAPDGGLYVTDTGVRFDSAGTRMHTGPDRVYVIRGREVTVALEGDHLAQPNGITWDARGRQFLIAPIMGRALLSWSGPGTDPEPVAQGAGRYDGVETLPDGRILVSAWNDSTVSVVAGDRLRPVLRGLPAGADIGVDPERGLVAVPLLMDDRLEIWRLPPTR